MTLRNALRAGTAEYHTIVDDLFGRFDMTDRRQYGAFLAGHARVVPVIELALEQGGIARLLSDWPERRRRDMLASDLATLHIQSPSLLDGIAFSSDEALWGAVYVLEGSKMGGAMLAKRVPAEFPATYLSYQGPKGALKAFMDKLNETEAVNEENAISAARAVFAAFRTAAELELEMRVS